MKNHVTIFWKAFSRDLLQTFGVICLLLIWYVENVKLKSAMKFLNGTQNALAEYRQEMTTLKIIEQSRFLFESGIIDSTKFPGYTNVWHSIPVLNQVCEFVETMAMWDANLNNKDTSYKEEHLNEITGLFELIDTKDFNRTKFYIDSAIGKYYNIDMSQKNQILPLSNVFQDVYNNSREVTLYSRWQLGLLIASTILFSLSKYKKYVKEMEPKPALEYSFTDNELKRIALIISSQIHNKEIQPKKPKS